MEFAMAIDKKPTDPTDPKDTTKKASDSEAPPAAMYSPGAVLTSPIVLTLDKKGKKRSEEHTELQSPCKLVCRLLLEKKKKNITHLFLFRKKKEDRQLPSVRKYSN